METKTIAWFSAGESSAVATKLLIDKKVEILGFNEILPTINEIFIEQVI